MIMKVRITFLAVILTLLVVPTFGALPTLSINDVTQGEGSFWAPTLRANGTTSFLFKVTLSAASASLVGVDFGTVAGTASDGFPGPLPADFSKTSGHLTFLPGETEKMVDVYVYADFRQEPDETFTIVLSFPTNADLADATGMGTILNDDAPPDPADLGVAVTTVDQPTHLVGEAA